MLRIFIAFVAILFSFSESYSQEFTPQFDHCRDVGSEDVQFCDQWQQLTEIIEYYSGCYIEATYALRKCTTNGNVNWQMELVGYRITNFPGCMGLYNSLYHPNGTVNQIKHREIQQKIYQIVANRVMENHVATLTQQEIDNDYTCVPCTTISGNFNNYCSKNGIPFFQAYSGTCMALCIAKETIDVPNDPYGPPAGMSAPNIIIPPNYQATIPAGLYLSHYFSYVKCNPYCCVVKIDYCYDPPSDPNVGTGRWVRLYNSFPTDNSNQCNPIYISSNVCPMPIRLWGSLVSVEYEPILQCQQSCTTIVDQIQTMQWE